MSQTTSGTVEPTEQAEQTLTVRLHVNGVLHEVTVPFTLDRTALSVEFRAQTYGAVPMSAVLHVDVESEERVAGAGPAKSVEAARA